MRLSKATSALCAVFCTALLGFVLITVRCAPIEANPVPTRAFVTLDFHDAPLVEVSRCFANMTRDNVILS